MIFHVVLEPPDDRGWIVVRCPALPGCVSQGKTEKEALDNIKEAIVGWLHVEDQRAIAAEPRKGSRRAPIAVAV
jgi:predicted RNase H-like HicB family nuclease